MKKIFPDPLAILDTSATDNPLLDRVAADRDLAKAYVDKSLDGLTTH